MNDAQIKTERVLAALELRSSCPTPLYLDFDIKTYEQMEALVFDDMIAVG
ncbi:hypothetical protein HQ563_00025 [bacterium]|nr:hypothetical protein [bacterium]